VLSGIGCHRDLCRQRIYGQINLGNFEIITSVGPLQYRGQSQAFIVQTPEPATIVLLLMGIGTMFVLGLKRQRQQWSRNLAT
jgi:hypothetical protein